MKLKINQKVYVDIGDKILEGVIINIDNCSVDIKWKTLGRIIYFKHEYNLFYTSKNKLIKSMIKDIKKKILGYEKLIKENNKGIEKLQNEINKRRSI